MDDYLSQDELKELAYYVGLQSASFLRKWDPSSEKGGSQFDDCFIDYRITMTFERGNEIPIQIIVQEMNRNKLQRSGEDSTGTSGFKTPLCVIRGYAENLKEDTVKEKLILKKEPVCLNGLIQAQLEKRKDLISARHLLILYQPEAEFVVTGDRQYLEQAVGNLMSNAVSCNMEHGTLRITVRKVGFSIENTGQQISEKDLPHIFEMFYSGNNRSGDGEKHLGLGLYLAKKICSLHHLTLTVRNTEMGVLSEVRL